MKPSTLLSLPTIPALAVVAAWSLDTSLKAAPPETTAKPEPKAVNPALTPKPPATTRPSSPANPGLTLVPADPSQPLLSSPNNETGSENANSAGAPLRPGIYTASPSTGIVVVPAPMDEAFEKRVGPDTRMPTLQPYLRLTPRPRAQPLPTKR